MSQKVNVAGAMSSFARDTGALSAFRLESCIHCGICADACHYYIATEDPQYTPIWKVEPFKQAYKREASAFAPLFRLLGLKREVTADQLPADSVLLTKAHLLLRRHGQTLCLRNGPACHACPVRSGCPSGRSGA